jgi:hypothetical protein
MVDFNSGCNLEEDEVSKVIQKYLASQKMKYYKQKGSGPDILREDGGVIETKGSGFDTKRSLEQFIRYPLTYPKLEIALPVDALSSATLTSLYIIERSLKAVGKPTIGIFLVTRVQDSKFKVRVYLSIEDLYDYVVSKLEEKMTPPADSEIEQSIRKSLNIILNIESEIIKILKVDANSVMGQGIEVL